MSDDLHKIDVTLNTTADPQVVIDPLTKTFTHKKKHKIEWKPTKESPDFTFETITINGQTFNNASSGKGNPAPTAPFSDVDVSDQKITMKDDVTDDDAEYDYVITVSADGKTYSSGIGETPKDAGRSAKIRNEA